MERDRVEAVVLTVVAAVLKCEVNPDTSRQNTPQWDSLKHIEIMFAVEEELKLEFSAQEMANLDSVARIVDSALVSHAA